MPRRPLPLLAALAAAAVLALPGPVRGQYVLEAPSGSTLTYDSARVGDMLERSRRLRKILEDDPDVIYYVGSGPAATIDSPASAYPWSAVRPRGDSAARVDFPANYREASRAYFNYAVKKMEQKRSRPSAPDCAEFVEREVAAVSAWVDGWIVARALFGGPAFAPLDAFAFAREAGYLPAMLVALDDSAIAQCLEVWRRDHPEMLEAYRMWRRQTFEAGAQGDAGDGGG